MNQRTAQRILPRSVLLSRRHTPVHQTNPQMILAITDTKPESEPVTPGLGAFFGYRAVQNSPNPRIWSCRLRRRASFPGTGTEAGAVPSLPAQHPRSPPHLAGWLRAHPGRLSPALAAVCLGPTVPGPWHWRRVASESAGRGPVPQRRRQGWQRRASLFSGRAGR